MMISDHLERERDQFPEAAAPRAPTTCSGPDGVAASAATVTSAVASSAKMKGVREPAFGPVGQRERRARDSAPVVLSSRKAVNLT